MKANETADAGRAARATMSVLKDLLKDYHPRDFSIRLWTGEVLEPEPGISNRFTLVLRHPGALRAMLRSGSDRAIAEAYIYDDIDVEGDFDRVFPMADYLTALRPGATNRIRLASQLVSIPSGGGPRAGRKSARLRGPVHSLERDRQAVTYHYNTSNEFFALFLDKEMVYSCAYFASEGESLDAAQRRKLDYICRKLRLKEGERILDIGCGWGGLITYAAKEYGVSAVGITLSEPQAMLAAERIRSDGLQDRCRVDIVDYRRIPEDDLFDKIVSIGMVEHVGKSRLPDYFEQAWRLLKPGGVFLNHGIASESKPGGSLTFSDAYVFPDSEPVPISTSLRVAEASGFEVRDVESLREHYALTLREWGRRLESRHEDAVKATDEATYRVWRLFMAGSEHGFKTGRLNVYQSLLVKPDRGVSGFPLTREDWYH